MNQKDEQRPDIQPESVPKDTDLLVEKLKISDERLQEVGLSQFEIELDTGDEFSTKKIKEAKVIALFPGFTETSDSTFQKLIEEIKKKYSNCLIVKFNTPGTSKSPFAEGSDDFSAENYIKLAEEALSQLTGFGAENIDAIGHSWGAALLLSRGNSKMYQRIIAVAPAFGISDKFKTAITLLKTSKEKDQTVAQNALLNISLQTMLSGRRQDEYIVELDTQTSGQLETAFRSLTSYTDQYSDKENSSFPEIAENASIIVSNTGRRSDQVVDSSVITSLVEKKKLAGNQITDIGEFGHNLHQTEAGLTKIMELLGNDEVAHTEPRKPDRDPV